MLGIPTFSPLLSGQLSDLTERRTYNIRYFSLQASRNYDCRSWKLAVELKDDGYSDIHKIISEISYDQRSKSIADTPKSQMSIHWLIELLVLCGIILFEDTRAALAASDIASALPSLPFLEDFGDISTGFASVTEMLFSRATFIEFVEASV